MAPEARMNERENIWDAESFLRNAAILQYNFFIFISLFSSTFLVDCNNFGKIKSNVFWLSISYFLSLSLLSSLFSRPIEASRMINNNYWPRSSIAVRVEFSQNDDNNYKSKRLFPRIL